jgi:hypothetical protein
MPTSSVISAIFRVRFDTKTFQDLSGLAIQNKATRLSIHTVTDAIGHLLNAATKFLAILAAMCPLAKSSLGMEVFLLAILDFDVRRP